MADIRLAKPAAGTTQTVPSAPDGRFIFDFPADAATLTRNGDDLVLTFEDGAAIQLQGFYTTYSKEEMPSFQVDGVEISGQDFFAALDEDLMPAAGPASGSSAARGGRYNEYGGSDLLDGLDHLGRLDIGFDGGTQLATDTVEPSPYSEVDHGVTVTPSTPGTDPDDPSIPVQGEDFPPTMPHDVLQVDESALDGGSGGGSATAAGSMRVSAPDGVAIITIGGVVVWQNGALTGNPVLTDEGHLDVTGFDGTNLTYTYTLTGSTQEHTKLNAGGENDAIAHEMAVVVTDTDGDSGSAVIRVEITDDVPTIESFEKTVTEGDADPIVGNALEGAVAGADGANFAWTNPDQQGRYGKLTLNEDGTYSYELNNDDPEVKALTDGDTRTEEISYAYTDADGDVATGKVTITINGVNNGVEVGSGTLTVYEAGLDDGSQAGQAAAPTTAEGSLTVNAPDGVKDIRIDGVTVFENGALTGNTVSTDEGTLTVTGFDEATGELKFTYELTGNTLEHNTDATDKQLSHDLAVTVTDVDGSTDTGVVTVVITDDGPVVTPVETEYKGNKYVNTVSVSFGADNDTGTDSSLAVNAHDVDGTVIEWIKVDDSTSSGTDLSKLSQGESWTNGNIIVSRENGNFVFKIKENGSNAHITVTATDADGDTDTEELNLTAPDAGPNAIIVDEALLTDGNVVNSDNSGHNPSGTGSFTVNLNGEDGTVTLNYGTGENSSITLSLINGETFDKDWLSTNKTLTVNGVVVEVTGATQQDGSWKIEYSYSLTGQQTHTGQGVGENDALSDEIDITVTDATGDTSTGSLTVTVHDDGPVLTDKIDFTVPEGKENYYDNSPEIMFTIGVSPNNTRLEDLEFGADVGEDTASAATLTVKVNGAEFTIQVTRDEDGNLHFSGDKGEGKILFTGPADADKEDSLSYDKETGIFTYTRPTADIGGTTNSYDVSLTITDADGDSATVSNIYTTVFRNPTVTNSTVTTDEGNIIMNDIPIGSGDENDKTSQVENTAQGSITVNLDHADGTITIGDMPITVDKDGNILSVNGNTGGILDGQTIKGTYGYLSNISLVAQGDGTITINYTYTLNAPVNGGTNNVSGRGDSHLADQFTVTVTTQGGTETGTITANALDDAPVLAVSNPESVKDTADTIEIPLEKFSVGADVISLDGKTASISVEVGENEYTFTIIHESNGTYSFIAPNNQDDNLKIESTAEGGYKIVYTRAPQDIADGKDDSYTFGITVTDADGDTATGSVTVCAKVVPPTINESGSKTDLLVDEDGLVHETNSKTDAGQLVVDMHGQAGTVTIGGVQVTVSTEDQVGWAMEPAQGRYGKLTITEATWNDGKLTINYEYTLQTPYTDSDNENGINTVVDADSFQILINGESSGSITVDIVDDVPTLTVENFHGAYGEGIDGTVNFDFGADNGEGTKIELSVNGGEKVAGASTDGKNWTFDVDGQTVTLNAETGEFHYDLPASGSNREYIFQFTVTDADDDEVSNAAPVTVTVEGTDLTGVKGSVTGDDDNVLTGKEVAVTMPELPAGVTLVANQWVNVTDADGKVYGQLHVDENGKVTFEQTVAYSGSQHNAQGESEKATGFSGNLTVNLADGTTSSITVDVSILDAMPTLEVKEFDGAYGAGINGTVDFGFGADNGEGTKIELSVNGGKKVAGVSNDGQNWTFMVDGKTVKLDAATGEFHYDLPASGSKDTYTFQFTVTDADGDEVSNAAPVTVEGTDLSEVKGHVTGDDDNVLTGEDVPVTMPELPAGVTLVANQRVNVTDADGKVYGQLIVDENGNVTFEQTVAYSGSQHNAQGESEDATGFSGNLTVNLADGTTSSITVDVSILDDIPTISNSDMSTSVILGDSSDNLAKVDEEISFINYKKIDVNDGKPVYEQTSTKVSTTYWNGQITISAAKVTYNGDDERGNPLITAEDTNGMQLLYSSYNGGTKQYYKDNNPPQEDKQNNIAHKDKDGNWYRDAPESDWGLTVGNSKDDGEIKATGDTSDAVVIDLEGYAYGITINFGAFFAGKSSPDDPAAGTGYDNVSEKALITFYKDGKLVYSTVEYGTNSGEFTFNTGDIVLEGFDKVVISAVDNSTPDFPNENSDFTIQGIDFITKRDDPIIINEGKVTAKSGADGFADAYTDSYAKFDLADMVEQNGGELNGDGTSGTITVLKDGTKQRVTLELSEGSSGESILTGTLESGEQLFTATLDKDGNWTMEQYEQFRVPGKQGSNQFELVFKTEDADGDISSTTVNVPLEVVDQTTTGTGVAIGNDNDSIVITGGDGVAGTVAAGDSGLSSRNLADAGDDTITAAGSDSSVIVYGDVMNTDRLLYELKQLEQSNSWVVAGAVVSDLPNYGSGTQVFQWLEANGEKLTGTDYAGWTHADTVDYMLRHADELGYETCVGDTGEFYLVKPDGTVLDMDGTEATVGLDSLTGRGGGDDTITGSKADDVIYGQEGNDLLVGDAPSGSGEGSTVDSIEGTTVASIKGMDSEDLDAFIQSVEGTDADGDDRLFGGTGDDVLLGMGGDDYIDGGAGEDAIFGGRGNDIIVYDSNDYLVSGGSGIDFMVSDDSTLTLTTLLSGGKDGHEGPIVDSIEVLITGKDALSLTSLEQMAKDYGISITGSSLKLNDDLWTQEGNGYRFTGDPDNGSTPDELFMQVNNDTDARVSVELVPSDDIAEAVQRAEIEHSNG
ncbi:VCBS domain-containing protein [Desulfovibrio piger]|uniref:VCBS domain-containing protein n=2 Tax=Desulfovibrio piger TaxID=901 RepID=UPI003AB77993